MKKIIICLFLMLIFSSTFCLASTVLYQNETENQISSGALLKNYNIFTEDGWLDIHVLEINLKDKYTKLDLLTSSAGSGKLKNVLTMAKEASAIAAINGDFFSGSNGKGHSIGLSIQNSEIISSTALENITQDSFASFLLTNDNEVLFDYLTNEVTLTSKKTKKSITISAINKYSDNYSTPVIYTRAWGETSLGSTDSFIVTEVVIEKNKVIDIRYNKPPVQIPENGFVITTLGDSEEWINKNIKKGTKIELDISLEPDLNKIDLAISGGAKLLENGLIPPVFSHNISGRNPRSAIGISKDKKTLYLVVVDGRSENSIGMTQTELAEFLKSIEVYDAINLDGGGSSSMVSQNTSWNDKQSLNIVNKPSGGSLRMVSNALGVFSTAPNNQKLYGLKLHIDDTNIFQGEERKIYISGYNKYYNPIAINFDEIEWDYEGVKVEINDENVKGNIVGSSTLIASIGKINTSIDLNILSPVNELFISPKIKCILPNETITYTIQAKNIDGFYAKTNPNSITTEIFEYYYNNEKQKTIPSDAKLENNSFSAKTPGEYILRFSKGNITSYTHIIVAEQKEILLDDFETNTFTFDEYPDEVLGNASLSTEQIYSGNSAVKLDYDFNQDIQIRGAYIELNTPYIIPQNATSLNFWVYNDSFKEEQLKIKLKDSTGNTKLIVLEKNITHEGWKKIQYDLSGISLPATLSDIYLAQDNINIKSSGHIYVDYLTYSLPQSITDSKISLPKDIKLPIEKLTLPETEKTFKIALLDTLENPTLMIDDLKNKSIINSINKNADLTIFTKNVSKEISSQVSNKVLSSQNYNVTHEKNITFISCDISNKSLRKTNAKQWIDLPKDIQESENKNIFIILNGCIDNFEDVKERKLFIDMLYKLKMKTEKNITVLHTGYFTDYSMENNITFLGTNTNTTNIKDIAKSSSYFLISVTGSQISYKIKNVFEK